jgi:hypothetical protein
MICGMATGFIYDPSAAVNPWSLASLKQALLFFDRIVLKIEPNDFDKLSEKRVEDIGWLREHGLLSSISAAEYMSPELVDLQLSLFRDVAAQTRLDWNDAEREFVGMQRLGPASIGDGYRKMAAHADPDLAEELYRQGWIVVPGRPLPDSLDITLN